MQQTYQQCQWDVRPTNWQEYGTRRRCQRDATDKPIAGLWLCYTHEPVFVARVASDLLRSDSNLRLQVWPVIADALAQERERARRAERAARGGHDSLVYFIGRDGFVKIGVSTNLSERTKAIAGGSALIEGISKGPVEVLATMPGDREMENRLHRRFDYCRIGGEWFLPDARMRLLIARLRARTPGDDHWMPVRPAPAVCRSCAEGVPGHVCF